MRRSCRCALLRVEVGPAESCSSIGALARLQIARGWRGRGCPTCKAPPGEGCTTPSGREASHIHAARLRPGVAVNLLSTFGDERAVEQALFGSFAVRVPIGGDASSAEMFRQQDGFWMRDGQPLATRVSVLESPALSSGRLPRNGRVFAQPMGGSPAGNSHPRPAARKRYDGPRRVPGY